jgi:hypothetical protein
LATAQFGHGETPLGVVAAAALNARFNVLKYKLTRAVRTAAIHNFNASLYFALSAAHEVGAIAELLHGAAQDMTTTIKCFQEPDMPLENWLAVFGVLGGLAYLYMHHLGTFKAKKY